MKNVESMQEFEESGGSSSPNSSSTNKDTQACGYLKKIKNRVQT